MLGPFFACSFLHELNREILKNSSQPLERFHSCLRTNFYLLVKDFKVMSCVEAALNLRAEVT